MHLRTGRQVAHIRIGAHEAHDLLDRLGQLAGGDEDARQQRVRQIALRVHHALGHAGGAAGVDHDEILRRTFDVEVLAAAARGELFIGRREGRHVRRTDFDEHLHLVELVVDLRHRVAKFARITDDRRVGIVDDVAHLVGLVAVVDVHMRQPSEKTGAGQLAVLDAVAQVERDLVAGLNALGMQVARNVVHPPRGLAPGDRPLTMDEGGRIGRRDAGYRFENIAEIQPRARRRQCYRKLTHEMSLTMLDFNSVSRRLRCGSPRCCQPNANARGDGNGRGDPRDAGSPATGA